MRGCQTDKQTKQPPRTLQDTGPKGTKPPKTYESHHNPGQIAIPRRVFARLVDSGQLLRLHLQPCRWGALVGDRGGGLGGTM